MMKLTRETTADALGWVLASLFAFLLIGMGAMGIASIVQAHEVPTMVVETALNNTYRLGVTYSEDVTAEDGTVTRERFRHMGTGVWINENVLLTNCHVSTLDRQAEIWATSQHHTQGIRMFLALCDEEADIAVLMSEMPNPKVKPLTIAVRGIQFGDSVYSAGYGLDMALTMKAGIAGRYEFGLGQSYIMPIISGDSGSPVFNYQGELVGLMHTGIMHPRVRVPLADKTFGTTNEELNAMTRNLNVRIKRATGRQL